MHGEEKCSLDELGDRREVPERIQWHLAQRRHSNVAERRGGEKRIAAGRRFHDRFEAKRA